MTLRAPPTRNGAAEKEALNVGTPNRTLYCSNLTDKVKKDDLKRNLYMLFSTYGPVLDIVVMRGKMRGQAHVVFRDIATSTQAMRAMQGFEFLGKGMRITYAKSQSHIFAKLSGTFEMPTVPAAGTEATELQKSIFNAPPSSIPAKPVETNGLSKTAGQAPQGTKRARQEEEGSEQEDAPMEEDDESDAPMEASSDED